MKPLYLDWLVEEKTITTLDGKQVTVFELKIQNNEDILNAWAKHLREHYCSDNEIDILRAGYGLEREAYLRNIKFPDEHTIPGPSVRSGDFTEILVADYVQYILGYIVPRTRYDRKVNRNSSTMGTDLIGYKCEDRASANDEMIVFEVKATASEVTPASEARLQKAVNDSNKDVLRLAESLNAVFQRLLDKNDFEGAKKIQRFQNYSDNPYQRVYAAAAVHSNKSYSENLISTVTTLSHIDPNLKLIVVHCDKLMGFIHHMYGRASNCQ